ncbi:M48 family metalloprotease [Leptolyngbya sp. KIOST-1]|uniref:M48 family metalloprotease n=1 Tax=Leptolyngbya sp. KIOST-1 TaxID=1229172 RepID=UPI00055C98F5|nr:M48 family metalloprotease [Leptolyngbya sp. KIOST-1]
MAQPIDPHSLASGPGRAPRSSVDAFYQQAIAAFKAQDYGQALARFQRLERLPPTSPYHLKALIGQVRVHQHLGHSEQVTVLCQRLLDSPSPAAQQWARQALGQRTKQEAAQANHSQPQPLSSPPAAIGQDLSGFVPLPSSSQGLPYTPPPTVATPTRPPSAPSAPSVEPAIAPPVAPPSPDAEPDERSPEVGSLFHYEQLNRQPESHGDGAGDEASEALRGDSTHPGSAANPAENFSGAQATAVQPRPLPTSTQRQDPLPQRPLALWLGQGLTAIALLWGINWVFHASFRALDNLVRWVRWPVQLSLPGAYQTYTGWIVGLLLLLGLASPWLMDRALGLWYRQRPFSLRRLQTQSPSSLRLLRQVCRQQGWPIPELRLIADPAPLCFSYGWLPRHTRIVVSQGLLDQSSDEELTAFYGYELARMVNGSLPVLSAIGLLLLLLHTGYRWLAQTADRRQPWLRGLLSGLATVLYGLFWLLRQTVLWLSRLCCRWGDRRAVALTQRPDLMIDGLLGGTAAIAAYLNQHDTLHPLHTSLEVLMPLSSRQAIAPGSLLGRPGCDRTPVLRTLLTVDGLNPYRQWLRVNAPHTPLGERLLWLHQQALRRGQPGLPLAPGTAMPAPPAAGSVSLPLLLLQKGPLAGLLAGGGLAMVLWFVGGVVNRTGLQRLNWLYQDPSILLGGLWLGLGLGLLLRINVLFPDTDPRSGSQASAAPIADLLNHSPLLPVQGRPVRLQGKLRGLTGSGNLSLQELYLDDASGLVKLVNPVPLASLQNLLQPSNQPFQWVGRRVTVTGWSRYGSGMLWIDLNQIILDQRHSFSTYGPIWATLASLVSSLIGIAIIFSGG